MKRMKPGRTNKKDRMNFVVYWANYVNTHSDEEWSRQQNVLIDSQLQSARESSALRAKSLLKKSKLTEKEAVELGRRVNKGVAKQYRG